MSRDEFDLNVKETLALRVGMRCSNPQCYRGTSGPREDPTKSVNVGVAAHITAASKGGPRYDCNISSDARCSIDNGIWLCQTCAKLVDNDAQKYTENLLRAWKLEAETAAAAAILHAEQRRDLKLRINPTSEGWKQLAQFQLLNRGPRAILITAWYVCWDASASESVITSRGDLPKRLEDQEPFDFTVQINDHPVESITAMGVVDGDGRRWGMDSESLKGFIYTAVAHRPPKPLSTARPIDVKECDVKIWVERTCRPGKHDLLEVFFLNNGSTAIPIHGAELAWEFDPPRKFPAPSGTPAATEIGGNVSLASASTVRSVQPKSQHKFYLRDQMANLLSVVLSSDVSNNNIKIIIYTPGAKWTETSDETAETVRQVANSIVASWKE